MPELAIERRDDGAAFAALRAEWSRLHDRSRAGPFLAWEWLYASWRRLTPHRAPRLFLARDAAGTLVGVLPLSEEQRPGRGPVWSFLGDRTVGSDYLDALCDPAAPGGEDRIARALWTAVLEDPGFEALDALDLDGCSPTVRALLRLAGAAGFACEARLRYTCPYIAVAGPFSDYLRRVSRVENLRRRQRWLEAQPGFAVEVATAPLALSRALSELFRLHRLRWAADGGSQGIPDARVEAFHRDAAFGLAERGLVRLYTLRLGGRAVASAYVLGRGGYRAFYQSGYDPELAARSPGLVLLARTIQDAFAEGASEFDFLRGVEPYKLEWSNRARPTVALHVRRRDRTHSLLDLAEQAAGLGRRCVKAALPAPWLASAQRLRRRWQSR